MNGMPALSGLSGRLARVVRDVFKSVVYASTQVRVAAQRFEAVNHVIPRHAVQSCNMSKAGGSQTADSGVRVGQQTEARCCSQSASLSVLTTARRALQA